MNDEKMMGKNTSRTNNLENFEHSNCYRSDSQYNFLSHRIASHHTICANNIIVAHDVCLCVCVHLTTWSLSDSSCNLNHTNAQKSLAHQTKGTERKKKHPDYSLLVTLPPKCVSLFQCRDRFFSVFPSL